MNRTKIEWVVNPDGTQGYTWNVVTGCERGCHYCYARRIAQRLKGRFGYPEDNPFAPTFHADKLRVPLKIKKPSTFFVVSMGDLFGERVPSHWVRAVLSVMWDCPQHTFVLLTKNPLGYHDFDAYIPLNAWLGVSVEHEETANRIEQLKLVETDCKKFVSFEPLLGMVHNAEERLAGVDWVIVGTQTFPNKEATLKAKIENFCFVKHVAFPALLLEIPVFYKNSLFIDEDEVRYAKEAGRREIPWRLKDETALIKKIRS
jgi:protein gp37